jgi:dCMP deaminase
MVLERISRDEYLMEVAHVVARRGTCSRLQVGVVFAREGRIVATGYNGAPPGIDHCVHESFYWTRSTGAWETPDWLLRLAEVTNLSDGCQYYTDGRTVSTDPGCTVVSHAERNGISFAAREGIRIGDSDVFCTHAPCEDCAKSLLAAGIRSLHYETPYRLTAGVDLLRNAGIELHHPS